MYRFWILLVVGLVGCGDGPETPVTCEDEALERGDRWFGLDLLDPPANGDFAQNTLKGQALGVEFTGLHLPWTAIEDSPGSYRDPDGVLNTLDSYLNQQGWRLTLTLRPIDLTGKTVPADLQDVRFNDPEFISRFITVLDFALSQVDHRLLTSLQIGNEIDGYDTSAEPPTFWADYAMFLAAVREHVHDHYLGLRVGFTGTLAGMLNFEGSVFEDLAEQVDVVGVTYYPIDGDFKAHAPESVHDDLANLVAKFPDNTIFLQEVGYPTGKRNASSQTQQAAFICACFQAWDDHAEQIELMNWVRLMDRTEQGAEDLAGPYGLSDRNFLSFLRTLGLREVEGAGTDKVGFVTLQEELQRRGW